MNRVINTVILLATTILMGGCGNEDSQSVAKHGKGKWEHLRWALGNNEAGSIPLRWGPVTLKVIKLGELELPTGRIIACDPGVPPFPASFNDTVKPGRYPVYATVATRENGDQRVAFGVLMFSKERPVKWVLAGLQGRPVRVGEHPEKHGYPVDSGTGCFMDETAATIVDKRAEGFFKELTNEMDKTSVPTWSWASILLETKNRTNIIAFSSGDGDGCYPSFWGLGESGERVALATDFYVVLE